MKNNSPAQKKSQVPGGDHRLVTYSNVSVDQPHLPASALNNHVTRPAPLSSAPGSFGRHYSTTSAIKFAPGNLGTDPLHQPQKRPLISKQ